MKTNKISYVIILSVCVIFICFAIWWSAYTERELKYNGVLLEGRIISILSAAKQSPSFLVEIEYEGQLKVVTCSSKVRPKNMFIDKTFPVIYAPKIEIAEILITEDDFNRYKLPYPDSLKWVKNYY